MSYIKYNDFVFNAETTRCWIQLNDEGEKIVMLNGYIRAYTTGAMRQQLDSIISGVREPKGKFYFGDQDRFLSVIRKEPLTHTESYEAWPPHEAAWGVKFEAEDPFWAEDPISSSYEYSAPFIINITGIKNSYPVFRVGFTGAPAVTIELKNNTTGESTDYAKTVVDGDVIVFNMEEREITKNGIVDITETEDEGFFSLEPGVNQIELTCSPATCDITYTYENRYR